jgi:hypothetical protein
MMKKQLGTDHCSFLINDIPIKGNHSKSGGHLLELLFLNDLKQIVFALWRKKVLKQVTIKGPVTI